MTEPYIISIILNNNRCKDTLECLESLSRGTYSNHTMIVLDNQTTDGSIDAIHERFPNVQIVPLAENLGYAGNNNVGIKIALEKGADWVFVLNEDTALDAACLAQLVAEGESDRQIGMVGPMVYHYNEPQYIQSGGGMLGPYWQSIHLAKDELDRGQLNEPHTVEWISGCAILVRRGVIEQAGMLDERFFLYWEETEWCLRARRAGWRIVHVPAAKLWHKGVQRNYEPKPFVMYYGTRNRLLMLSKHRAPLKVWIFAFTEIIRTLVSWTVRPKWRRKRSYRNAMWRGLVDFFRHRWGRQEAV